MKKFLRIALAVAVIASLAPIALANPGGGAPQPLPQMDSLRVAVALVLSLLVL